MKKFVLALALSWLAMPSSANDSSSAIGLGGLQLTQNDAISMDSEDLFLSRNLVQVKYRFTNTSAKDVETLVSFPLPAIPKGVGGYMGDQGYPNWKDDLNFKTMVDGKPVALSYHEEVSIIDRPNVTNVAARLKALSWPLHYWDDWNYTEKYIAPLSLEEKKKLVAEGFLFKIAEADYFTPNWQVQAHVTRKQVFPAGKTMVVEHSYKPVVGGSVGGILERASRKEEGFKGYAADYCIDKSFLKGFDKRRYSGKKDSDGNEVGQFYVEHWLDYVLKSGANWKGPIKDFRLVVDKEKPGNLMSFCMTGVKKISPTQFEIRKTNFEPAQDIRILITEFIDQGAG